jgi:hypothetical protein
MKIDTVLSRETKRDFLDLYFLSKQFGPDEILEYYDGKYGNLDDKELMMGKALVYFNETDGDEMPRMLAPLDWQEAKAFFLKTFIQ